MSVIRWRRSEGREKSLTNVPYLCAVRLIILKNEWFRFITVTWYKERHKRFAAYQYEVVSMLHRLVSIVMYLYYILSFDF